MKTSHSYSQSQLTGSVVSSLVWPLIRWPDVIPKLSFSVSFFPFVGVILALCISLAQAFVFQEARFLKSLELLPWLIAIVFVGLPHGATDYRVLSLARSKHQSVFLFAVYTLVVLSMFGLLVAFPAWSVGFFLLISMWHFGHAGIVSLNEPPRSFGSSGLMWFARSSVVLGMPLFAHADATRSVVDGMTQCVNPVRDAFHLGIIDFQVFSLAFVQSIGTLFLILGFCVWCFEGMRSVWLFAVKKNSSDFNRYAREVAVFSLFACLGWCASPLLSVGTFFLWWHSWREIPDIAASLSPAPLCDAKKYTTWQSVRLIHEAALPLLIPSWILLFLMWWCLAPVHTFYYLVVVSLIFYLIVTPSHEWLAQVLSRQPCVRT